MTRRRGVRAHADRPVVPRRRAADGRSARRRSRAADVAGVTREQLREAKRLGLSDRDARPGDGHRTRPRCARAARSSASCPSTSPSTRARPSSRPRRPTSTRPTRTRTSRHRTGKPKVIILGGGPNRIGQGIEFDYCCVHACYALTEAGFETIMVNCNPETVSTDYDTSDRLYFEPLTFEDVLGGRRQREARRRARAVRRPDAAEARARARGGGLSDLRDLARVHRPRRGPRALRRAPRRARPRRAGRTRRRATSRRRSRPAGASATRSSCGPSYVLGGRAMAVVFDETLLSTLRARPPSRAPASTPS